MYSRSSGERIRDGMAIGEGKRRMAEVGATIMRHVPLIKQKLRSRVCKWRLFARCRLTRVIRMTHAYGRTVRALQRRAGFRSRRSSSPTIYTRRWANTHDLHGSLRRVSAILALISGKPPQIRPANSASLSLIVAKDDATRQRKGKMQPPHLFLAPPHEAFLPNNRVVGVYFLFFLNLFSSHCWENAYIHHQLFCRRHRSFGFVFSRFCKEGEISQHLAKRGKNGDRIRAECVIKDGPGRSLAEFCACKRARGRIFIRRSWVFHRVCVDRKSTFSMLCLWQKDEGGGERIENKFEVQSMFLRIDEILLARVLGSKIF